MKQDGSTLVIFKYPSFLIAKDAILSLGSKGFLGDAVRRGNNSINVTSPIAVRTNPTIVKNSPCLLDLAELGWDAGSGIVGTSICRCLLFLPFGFLVTLRRYAAALTLAGKSSKLTASSSVHTWCGTPASIAGVTRNVW
jgi:hypothetical protein